MCGLGCLHASAIADLVWEAVVHFFLLQRCHTLRGPDLTNFAYKQM